MRRVLIWRNHLLPLTETFIQAQAAALTRWDATLAGVKTDPAGLLVQPGFTIAGDSAWGRLRRASFRRTQYDPGLQRYLDAHRPALVHAHFATDARRVLPTARRAGVPLIFTAHGYDVTTDRARATDWTELFAYASSMVAVSEFIADQLLALGAPEEKVRLLPVGVRVPAACGARREGKPRIAFVGRLIEKKGCADLLAAVARLPGRLRGTEVVIVGDGPLRRPLTAQADRLGLNAVFMGARPASEVRAVLTSATVLSVPSRRASDGDTEGFGLVFLEAAAAGLPVVTYRSGGTGEAVVDGRTGVLCPEGDIGSLSSALCRLLTDDALRRSLGEAGRQRVVDHFDVRTRTLQLEAEYDRVAAGRWSSGC